MSATSNSVGKNANIMTNDEARMAHEALRKALEMIDAGNLSEARWQIQESASFIRDSMPSHLQPASLEDD